MVIVDSSATVDTVIPWRRIDAARSGTGPHRLGQLPPPPAASSPCARARSLVAEVGLLGRHWSDALGLPNIARLATRR